jgi:tetratricopeptide (TPR) repeat protein
MLAPLLSKPEQREPSIAGGENENVQQLPDFSSHGMVQLDDGYKDPLEYLASRRSRIIKQLNPAHNARAVVELGDIHLAKKELKQAENAYRDAIKKDPGLVDAYKKLIPLLVTRKQLKSANNYFIRLLNLSNGHPDVEYEYQVFRMSLFSDDSNVIDEVKDRFEQLIKKYPQRVEFKNALGILLLVYRADTSKAASYFRSAISLRPENIDALNNYGICLQREGKYAEAYEHYRKALSVDSKYTAAYENIASNFVAQGKLKDALDSLLEGDALGLTYTPLWDHNTGWLMILTRKFEDAKKWYIDKIKKEPGNSLLLNNLGACYEGLGKLKLAEKNYQASVELSLGIRKSNPEYNDQRALNAYYNLCRLLYRFGNYQKLEIVSKHIISFNANDPIGLYYVGAARIQLKKHIAARQALEKSIAINSNVIEPYIDLSFLLTSIMHDYSAAIDLLNDAMNKGMSDSYLTNNLAYAYVKSDNIERAEELLDFQDKNPNMSATRGLIEFHRGNFTEGNKLYEKAIKAIPKDKRDEAIQVWRYEQAAFWFRNSNYKKANNYLEKAKALGEDYFMYESVIRLEKDIKTKLKY